MKHKILYWLPVAIFPILNICSLVMTSQSLQMDMIYLVGAILEELIFRWFLLKKLLKNFLRLEPSFAIIIVATLFSTMHLFNLRTGQPFDQTLIQVLYAFCFSIWAGTVVWQRNSILIPLLAHVLLNLTSVDNTPLTLQLTVCLVVLVDGLILMKGI